MSGKQNSEDSTALIYWIPVIDANLSIVVYRARLGNYFLRVYMCFEDCRLSEVPLDLYHCY